jgi:hypothetical protein
MVKSSVGKSVVKAADEANQPVPVEITGIVMGISIPVPAGVGSAVPTGNEALGETRARR